MPNEHDPKHSKGFPWSVILPAAALGLGLGKWLVDRADSIHADVSSNAVCCSDYRAYKGEDSSQRRYWVGVIDQLRTAEHDFALRVSGVEFAIKELRNKPESRADPFTGADGERLRQRIQQLEEAIETNR